MPKTVLHLFHADPASMSTVPALADRIRADAKGALFEVYIFGPAEQVLADATKTEFNAQIDALVAQGVQITTCIGLAQKFGAEAQLRSRGITLESAATAFPRFASEGATVISF